MTATQGTHETACKQIGNAAEVEYEVEDVERQTRRAVRRDIRWGQRTMVSLLTGSDDWNQSCSVVAHLRYSVVSSGQDRLVQVDVGSKLSKASNPTGWGKRHGTVRVTV